MPLPRRIETCTLDSKHDNGELEELRHIFTEMLGPTAENKFQVVNFRETEPLMNGPAGLPTSELVRHLPPSFVKPTDRERLFHSHPEK